MEDLKGKNINCSAFPSHTLKQSTAANKHFTKLKNYNIKTNEFTVDYLPRNSESTAQQIKYQHLNQY